jgi:hypothetical protein
LLKGAIVKTNGALAAPWFFQTRAKRATAQKPTKKRKKA